MARCVALLPLLATSCLVMQRAPDKLAELHHAHARWVASQPPPSTWLGHDPPTCPCVYERNARAPEGWYRDSSWANPFHPGSTHGLRSNPLPSGGGVQCRYDDDGKLVTEGIAAGSGDIAAPVSSAKWRAHFVEDVQPACRAFALSIALWSTSPIEDYFRVRPVSVDETCPTRRSDRVPPYPAACGPYPL